MSQHIYCVAQDNSSPSSVAQRRQKVGHPWYRMTLQPSSHLPRARGIVLNQQTYVQYLPSLLAIYFTPLSLTVFTNKIGANILP